MNETRKNRIIFTLTSLISLIALSFAWFAEKELAALEKRLLEAQTAQALFNSWTAGQMAAGARHLVRDGVEFEFDPTSLLEPDGTNVLEQPGRSGRWIRKSDPVTPRDPGALNPASSPSP